MILARRTKHVYCDELHNLLTRVTVQELCGVSLKKKKKNLPCVDLLRKESLLWRKKVRKEKRDVLPGEDVLPLPRAPRAATLLIADCASLQPEADPIHRPVPRSSPWLSAPGHQHQVPGRGTGRRFGAHHPYGQEAFRGNPRSVASSESFFWYLIVCF